MTTELAPAKVRLSDQLGRADEARCMCGEMLLSACPGEWEPGCDLGNNPEHARPARAVLDTDDIEVLREALAVAWGDSMTAQLKNHDQAAEIQRLRTVAENTVSLLEHLTNSHQSATKHALCWRVLEQAREVLKA